MPWTTVTRTGCAWTAPATCGSRCTARGRVRCYSPAAEVLHEVELPVRLVTACTFGGEDLRDLYVTTSRENLENPEPEAGALFRVRVEVPGKPVLPYAG